MKKYFLTVTLVFIILQSSMFSQCPMGVEYAYTFDSSTLSLGTRTEIICCLWGNEYMSISNMVAGQAYSFDNCGVSYDSEITIFDPNNNPIVFNSNGCGDDGLISNFVATISGTYKIQTNFPSCSNGSINTAIYVTLETTLGLDDNNFSNLKIYPNPVIDEFKIETNQSITEINVYNIEGKLVMLFKQNNNSYNLESLPAGLYFIDIRTAKGQITKKIIKN